MSELEYFRSVENIDISPCPSSTVTSTFNLKQYVQLLEIARQISCVLRGIKQAIS